jgi:hypothetical protein
VVVVLGGPCEDVQDCRALAFSKIDWEHGGALWLTPRFAINAAIILRTGWTADSEAGQGSRTAGVTYVRGDRQGIILSN